MLSTKHSAEERAYDLRKWGKYGATQTVEVNRDEESRFVALRMNYYYVDLVAQDVW